MVMLAMVMMMMMMMKIVDGKDDYDGNDKYNGSCLYIRISLKKIHNFIFCRNKEKKNIVNYGTMMIKSK